MLKVISVMLLLAVVPFGAYAHTAAKNAGKTKLVKAMSLEQFFHTHNAWQLQVYQANGLRPLRVCFVESTSSSNKHTTCHSLHGGNKLDSVQLTLLPSPQRAQPRASILMHVTWAGGLASLSGSAVYVWNFDKRTGNFFRSLESAVSFSGSQKFVRHGPIAGLFISVDAFYEGDEPNMNTPTRYKINVYAPAARGYKEVLSFLSKKRYPDRRSGKGLKHPIAVLSPEITKTLHAVYRGGMPSLTNNW